jgi:hypothetical protein
MDTATESSANSVRVREGEVHAPNDTARTQWLGRSEAGFGALRRRTARPDEEGRPKIKREATAHLPTMNLYNTGGLAARPWV